MRHLESQLVSKREVSWNGIRANLVRRADLRKQETVRVASEHSIFLNILGLVRHGEIFIEGRRISSVGRPQGPLTYFPPDCSWSGWDERDEEACYLLISIEREAAHSLSMGNRHLKYLKPEFGFYDLGIEFAARMIASEIFNNDHSTDLVVEGYVKTILGHLQRRTGKSPTSWRGGLAPSALKIVLALVDHSYDQKLSLSLLSASVGLSVEHFCRAFKYSMGCSPHLYICRRRLERASELLREDRLSITQIAFLCGYASASHFSSSFRSAVGVPPKIYRSAWSG